MARLPRGLPIVAPLVAAVVSAALACSVEQANPGDPSPPPSQLKVPDSPPDPLIRPSFDDGSLALGETVRSMPPPPPISGGTLAIAPDGRTAIASDPDRDRVFIVDTVSKVVGDVALLPGDEPGRIAVDPAGRAYVALRRGGAVAVIDLSTRTLVGRRPVCPAPRGIAYDPASVSFVVACAGGEVVFMPSGAGPARTVRVEADLRDVVVSDGRIYVSRFRAAELLHIDADGSVVSRRSPAPTPRAGGGSGPAFRGSVAWRAIALPGRGVIMLHQRASLSELSSFGGYYGASGGGGIIDDTVAIFPESGLPATGGPGLPAVVLAVDAAVSPDGTDVVVVAPGGTHVRDRATLLRVPVSAFGGVPATSASIPFAVSARVYGEPVAVAFTPSGHLVVQSREPAALVIDGVTLELAGESRRDTGHAIFHTAVGTSGGVACASCHPEGGDDGVTWHFDKQGLRRTQSIRGGILATAPFHWDGAEATFADLVDEVWARRMFGPGLYPAEVDALARWVDAIPAVPPSAPRDTAAAERGRVLFSREAQGCSTCHSGPLLGNNATVDVGTGGAFQVPSLLGVSLRAPYLHDGCAPTLLDRFIGCGGGDRHGRTSHLTEAQLRDLVAHLERL